MKKAMLNSIVEFQIIVEEILGLCKEDIGLMSGKRLRHP